MRHISVSVRMPSRNEIMCQGKEKLDYYMKDSKKRINILSKKVQLAMYDMKILQDMYAR